MTKVILIGHGRMGTILKTMIEGSQDMELVAVYEVLEKEAPESKRNFEMADVVIDFSHPNNLEALIEIMKQNPLPLVMATTGFDSNQQDQLNKLGEELPLFYASNFSIGINLMKHLIIEMKKSLGEAFDIEVIEKHHRHKVDSPSGTALTLVEALDPEDSMERVYGREGMKRRGRELGIHSIRGGTIAGEHTVIFAGEDEVMEISHKAESPRIFAIGALKAVRFLIDKEPGFYGMDDLL